MTAGYTWAGAQDAELVARRAIDQVRAALVAALPARSYRAILLVGGYGRGEGGVLRTPGGVRLHNNLDLLIIAAGPWVAMRARLQARAAAAVLPIVRRIGVGIDVGVIGDWTLRHAPCRVFYYDLRFGHRTLAGDPTYAPSLPFEARDLVGEDILALVANRGTLLAINQELFANGQAPRGTVIKHAVKAILGYGDGWLWSKGRYHWSYAERLRRMLRSNAPSWLVERYEQAADLRFSPREDALARVDLAAWNAELVTNLEPIHRLVVERVDGAFHGWEAHRYARSLRARIRERLGGRPSLPRLFPLVAYHGSDASRALAAQGLGIATTDLGHLRHRYLHAWGGRGDPNFGTAAAAMGLTIGATS